MSIMIYKSQNQIKLKHIIKSDKKAKRYWRLCWNVYVPKSLMQICMYISSFKRQSNSIEHRVAVKINAHFFFLRLCFHIYPIGGWVGSEGSEADPDDWVHEAFKVKWRALSYRRKSALTLTAFCCSFPVSSCVKVDVSISVIHWHIKVNIMDFTWRFSNFTIPNASTCFQSIMLFHIIFVTWDLIWLW